LFNTLVYRRSPVRIQECLLSCRATLRKIYREGRAYRTYLSRAIERENWSVEQLAEFQHSQLRNILSHASTNVPYYESFFCGHDFSISSSNSAKVLAHLPVLTKHDIAEAGDSLLTRGGRLTKIKGSTSGTTGTPITLSQDHAAICRENAFVRRQLAWAGYKEGERNASLRGDMVVGANVSNGTFWRESRSDNMLMMSSYHLAENTALTYLKALRKFGPTMIQAYPSSISFLARFLESTNSFYESPCLRSIVTSSETLDDSARRLIEHRFQCRVFDWYGAFERVAAIGTCEKGSYHLLTDYSYIELEPLGDGTFELIGTGFNNYLMPLIRFKTGDTIELPDSEEKCDCGRSFPVVKRVIGRKDDYLKLPGGRRIGRIDHIFKGLSGIAEAQVIQDEIHSIRILVVPLGAASNVDTAQLVGNTNSRLGSDIEVEVEIVSSIPRTASGKFRSVICNV